MKAECHLFQYLDAVLKSRCSQVIAETLHSARSTPALGWLDRLILTIHTGCQSYSTINVNSSHFIPDYIVPEQVMSMKSRSRIVGEEELIVDTHQLLRSLLTKWFNIPCHFRAQAQQHLVQELLDHIGASVLYLPQTWIVHSTCPKWLLSPSNPTNYYKRGNQSSKYDKIYLEPFVLGLTSSPICNPTSVKGVLLRSIGAAYQGLLRDDIQHWLHRSLSLAIAPPALLLPLPIVDDSTPPLNTPSPRAASMIAFLSG